MADIVAKGDPDRFDACMAAPVAARAVLFPIYAFNVEVSRATWAVSEPMIGEMRLQWLQDALDDIANGKAARKHEVITSLADVLDSEGAQILDQLVRARPARSSFETLWRRPAISRIPRCDRRHLDVGRRTCHRRRRRGRLPHAWQGQRAGPISFLPYHA